MALLTLASGQTTAGPGAWFPINPLRSRSFQIIVTGVASIDIEYSNDGTNPVLPAAQSGITSSTGYVDDEPWLWVRSNAKTITSGAVSVLVGAGS